MDIEIDLSGGLYIWAAENPDDFTTSTDNKVADALTSTFNYLDRLANKIIGTNSSREFHSNVKELILSKTVGSKNEPKVKYYINWSDFEKQQLVKRGSSLKTLYDVALKNSNSPPEQEIIVRYRKLYAIINALSQLLPNFNSKTRENQEEAITALDRSQFKAVYNEILAQGGPQTFFGAVANVASNLSSLFSSPKEVPEESTVARTLREQSQTEGGGNVEEGEETELLSQQPLQQVGGLRQREVFPVSRSESSSGAQIRSLASEAYDEETEEQRLLKNPGVGKRRTALRVPPFPYSTPTLVFNTPTLRQQPPQPPQLQFSQSPQQQASQPLITPFVPFDVKYNLTPQTSAVLPSRGAVQLNIPGSGGEQRSSSQGVVRGQGQQVQQPQQQQVQQQVQQQQVQQQQQQQQQPQQQQAQVQALVQAAAQGAAQGAYSTIPEINRKIGVIQGNINRVLSPGQAQFAEAQLVQFKKELQDVYDVDSGETLKRFARGVYGAGNENFFLCVVSSDPRFPLFPDALTQYVVAQVAGAPDVEYLNRVTEYSQV
jgi:hypothetical protein